MPKIQLKSRNKHKLICGLSSIFTYKHGERRENIIIKKIKYGNYLVLVGNFFRISFIIIAASSCLFRNLTLHVASYCRLHKRTRHQLMHKMKNCMYIITFTRNIPDPSFIVTLLIVFKKVYNNITMHALIQNSFPNRIPTNSTSILIKS